MANVLPLVFKDGQIQQLQAGDGLTIPLEERVIQLEALVAALVAYFVLNGFEMPPLDERDHQALLKEFM